jgi:N-sulfoglucosamine sulfohydrolase
MLRRLLPLLATCLAWTAPSASLVSAAEPTAIAAPTAPAAAKPRRNVLLYVVDDLGTDDAGCYGHPVVKTPGLDALAAAGTRFTHAFCTTASCSASRSVILTGLQNHANGQYGHEHAFHHFRTFPRVKSLPVLLGEAGYRTASAGKFHVAPEEVYRFQRYIRGPSPEQMADNCRELLTEESDRPFFLYFCTTESHRPFRREGSDEFDPADVVVPPYLPDTPECRRELAQYYGSVQRMDRGLVRLVELLKATGHWDDTLVIFISDNGIAFPGAKTTVYEPGIRLPCVIRLPGAEKQGAVSDAMISWVDLTPTILDYAGAKLPPGYTMHGRSFLPVLEGKAKPGQWDEIYASHTFHEITMYYPMRVVRTRNLKLILNLAHPLPYPFASDLHASATWQGVLRRGDERYGPRTVEAYIHRPRWELYDLENDPWESTNLADDPQYADALGELQAKLKTWQKRTGDPWIVKYEYE